MGIRNEKFAFWQTHDKDVLLIGLSGTGKTTMLREALEQQGLKIGESVAYYSPHAGDFVGDPTTARVLLFDTLNDPQAQKAVQEVLGLKLWKGKPVTAAVWGSYTVDVIRTENKPPEGTARRAATYSGEYTVSYEYGEVPKFIHDLFEVAVEVPYRPYLQWFTDKFGKRLAEASIAWWDELPEMDRYRVSPKRLASALEMYVIKGDMRDVLPLTSNVAKLMTTLNTGPITEKLDDLLNKKDEAGTRLFLANENNYQVAIKHISKSESYMAFFLPLLPKEKLVVLMGENDQVCHHVIRNIKNVKAFEDICKQVLQAGTNAKLTRKIRRSLQDEQIEIPAQK